jgi:hypothetical protein
MQAEYECEKKQPEKRAIVLQIEAIHESLNLLEKAWDSLLERLRKVIPPSPKAPQETTECESAGVSEVYERLREADSHISRLRYQITSATADIEL